MKTKHILIFVLISTIISCRPSQEEIKKREVFVADSLALVEQQIEEERIHLEKIEVGKSINKTKLTKILENANSQLLKEKSELNEINEFQFARSASTKRRQLKDQNAQIIELETFIAKVEKEISLTNLYNAFDFQVTPRGTVEHIFYAANSKDYSKMRHLLDPYGEYKPEAQELCLVEMLPADQKRNWSQTFKNGRIMSDPVITKGKAEIEIAIGSSSNQLEKIKLVKRMDKWYVSGI